MMFLLMFLPKTFFGCVPGVSADGPVVLLRIVLGSSRWLADHCIGLMALDLAKAFDSLTKQAIIAAMAAWGILGAPFHTFILSLQNCGFFVEGLKDMPNPSIFKQDEGEGTGAPQSSA